MLLQQTTFLFQMQQLFVSQDLQQVFEFLPLFNQSQVSVWWALLLVNQPFRLSQPIILYHLDIYQSFLVQLFVVLSTYQDMFLKVLSMMLVLCSSFFLAHYKTNQMLQKQSYEFKRSSNIMSLYTQQFLNTHFLYKFYQQQNTKLLQAMDYTNQLCSS